MLETLANVFFSRSQKKNIFVKVSRKLDIMNHYSLLRATTSCRPRSGSFFLYRTIGSSQASEGEPNTMVLKHLHQRWFRKSQGARSKCSSQASKSEALREPNTKAPGVCFSSDAPPADGWGLRMGVFSRKFRESSAKGESQSAL